MLNICVGKKFAAICLVGGTEGPKYGHSCDNSKFFTYSGSQCAAVRCASAPKISSFYTWGGPLADAILSLRQTPTILPLGAPGHTHPKKFVP